LPLAHHAGPAPTSPAGHEPAGSLPSGTERCSEVAVEQAVTLLERPPVLPDQLIGAGLDEDFERQHAQGQHVQFAQHRHPGWEVERAHDHAERGQQRRLGRRRDALVAKQAVRDLGLLRDLEKEVADTREVHWHGGKASLPFLTGWRESLNLCRPMAAAAPPAAPSSPLSRFGTRRHLALASFWFGNFFIWQPLNSIVLATQVDALIPKESQGTMIGLALGLGGIFAMAVPPLVGAYSDRLTTRWGRRRPIMAAGTAGAILGLAIMAFAQTYLVLVIGYMAVQAFFNAAGAAYAGLVPDVVPDAEFGRASGFLATMVQLGSGFGLGATTATAGMDLRLIYSIMGVVVLITLVPTLWVAAGEGTTPIPRKPRL